MNPDARGVLVIGAGGLGCPAIRRLAAAGVSRLGVAEFDTVEESNLPRQTLYRESDVGRPKLEVVRERLDVLPGRGAFLLELHDVIVRGDEDWLDTYAVIIDAVDTAEQKFALHDAIVRRNIPFVHAGASGWDAQLFTIRGPGCLRCLFGESKSGGEEAPGYRQEANGHRGEASDNRREAPGCRRGGPGDRPEAPDCRRAGILGPVVGLAGTMAAGEALRLADGSAGRYERQFWTLDARRGRTRVISVAARAGCWVCGDALP